MKKTYRYRLYPTKTQESLLRQTFGCCRFVYNHTLDAKIKAYEKDKTSLSGPWWAGSRDAEVEVSKPMKRQYV